MWMHPPVTLAKHPSIDTPDIDKSNLDWLESIKMHPPLDY